MKVHLLLVNGAIFEIYSSRSDAEAKRDELRKNVSEHGGLSGSFRFQIVSKEVV